MDSTIVPPTKYQNLGDIDIDGQYVGKVCYPLQYNRKARKLVPNPTIFWLLAPDFHKQISTLEEDRLIERIEQRLRDDPEAMRTFREQHIRYQEYRWNMLSDQDKQYVKSQGWEGKFRDTGIGGIRNWESVKCLHLHFAHYCFNGDNIVGSWVWGNLGISDCTPIAPSSTTGT